MQDRLTLVDQLRLVEILSGSDAALAMLDQAREGVWRPTPWRKADGPSQRFARFQAVHGLIRRKIRTVHASGT